MGVDGGIGGFLKGREMLLGLIERSPNDEAAWWQLVHLDPVLVFDRWAAQPEGFVAPEKWGHMGIALLEAGRESDAIRAWEHALTLAEDMEVAPRLLQHAPGVLWARLRELTSVTEDDELLGDVADLYWQHGNRAEAIQLWRRANRIDLADDEWSQKLWKATAGLDPLE